MASLLQNLHTSGLLKLSAGLLAAVFALHFWVIWVSPLPGDRWAATQAGPWSSRPWAWREAGYLIQLLGTAGVALAIVGVGLVLLLTRGSPGEAEGLLLASTAIIACELLKHLFGRTELSDLIVQGGLDSYPSGHVSFVTATIGFLGLCAWRHGARRTAYLAVALIVLVGPERVLSGVHTVSDVIGGYLLAGAWLALAEVCVQRKLWVLPRLRWGMGG